MPERRGGAPGQRLARLAAHVRAAHPAEQAASEPADRLYAQYVARMEELGMPVPPSGATTRGEYHTAEGLAQADILDWPAVQAQFDEEAFLRDGVAVLKGIFTPAATRRLRESCERCQLLNDSWLDVRATGRPFRPSRRSQTRRCAARLARALTVASDGPESAQLLAALGG